MMIRFMRHLLPQRVLRNFSVFGNEKGMANDTVEGVVCQESEIPENGMKVCDLGSEGGKVLLVKQKGELHAIGTKCSHYGAPLVSGALGEGRVRCPWHGACFNISNGDIEDFPGLDSIPSYSVEVLQDGGVKVRASKTQLAANKRLKEMSRRDPNNSQVFLIVGGGAAGQVCAESLRQSGYTGRLLLVTAEEYFPYDRIKLSKQLDITIDKIQLRSEAFYKEHDIEVLLGKKATKLEPTEKRLHLSDGQTLDFSKIFIATGSTPRVPRDLPGVDLENVFTLRSLEDAGRIAAALGPEKKVIIYGSSFIGMEAAAFCVSKCCSVTVVGRSQVPFEESLGRPLGQRIARLFTEKGVHLKMGQTITQIRGNGKVEGVTLSSGEELIADAVVLGLGATPATGFLQDSGLKLSSQGTLPVNQFLETSCPDVLAGGDVAEAPLLGEDSLTAAIGHWGLAHYHGRIAATNMAAAAAIPGSPCRPSPSQTPLKAVPFFWTMLFGTSFRFAGYNRGYTETVEGGDLDSLKWACYFTRGGSVLAVVTVGVDPLAAAFAERLASGKSLSRDTVAKSPLDWHKEQ